MPPNLEP